MFNKRRRGHGRARSKKIEVSEKVWMQSRIKHLFLWPYYSKFGFVVSKCCFTTFAREACWSMMWMTAIWAPALPEIDQKPKNPAKPWVSCRNPGFLAKTHYPWAKYQKPRVFTTLHHSHYQNFDPSFEFRKKIITVCWEWRIFSS